MTRLITHFQYNAYKEGRLYNTIGHEFTHTIEGTEGYKALLNNFVKGLTPEQRQDKIKEYADERGYGWDKGEQYLLEEAFADYIGENIAVNYKEFSKMLGTNSKFSMIKEKLFGCKGTLTNEFRNVQGKVSEILKGNTNQLEMTKASRNTEVNRNGKQEESRDGRVRGNGGISEGLPKESRKTQEGRVGSDGERSDSKNSEFERAKRIDKFIKNWLSNYGDVYSEGYQKVLQF